MSTTIMERSDEAPEEAGGRGAGDPTADPTDVSRETTTATADQATASDAAVAADAMTDPVTEPEANQETDAVPDALSEQVPDATTRVPPTPRTSPAEEATPLAKAVEYSLLVRQGLHRQHPLPRPDRPRVMVVANQKGGVGKTTTTVNLAATMAQHGLRVLVVDLDPQGNASTALSVDHRRGTPSTYDALVEGVPFADIVQESPEASGLFVVPSTIDLAGAEIELVSVVARENRLRKAIHGYPPLSSTGEDRIDYVLVDCPPSLGLLTLNALVAAEELLLPIQAEYYALEGVGQLLETVDLVRANLNPALTISTVLLTMVDSRTRLSAGVVEEVRAHFGERVLRTAIPRSVRVSEAPSYGKSVMTYDPASPGALSYLEAARELTQRRAPAGPADVPAQAGPEREAPEDTPDQTHEPTWEHA